MYVETAFGHLKGRWRVLMKRQDTHIENAIRMIATCFILHNICIDQNDHFDEEWAVNVQDEGNIIANNNIINRDNMRDYLFNKMFN